MALWKEIPGYEDFIINESGTTIINTRTCSIVSQSLNENGYLVVSLRGKIRRVHRLVGFAFVPNPFNKPEINHWDCNKTNNHYTNLDWSTKLENVEHAVVSGLYLKGKENRTSKLKDVDVLKIRSLYSAGYRINALANLFPTLSPAVASIQLTYCQSGRIFACTDEN